MAEIIEGTPVEPGEDDEVLDLFEQNAEGQFTVTPNMDEEVQGEPQANDAEPDQTTSTTEADAEGEQIPDKFRGKTKAEIAAIYADLEREFGRRNNELGELRKITDDILRKQLDPSSSAETGESTDELTADDLLNNPVEAIRKVIQNDPEAIKAREAQAEIDAARKLEAFKTAHPDAKDIMANAAFNEWLNKVPSRAQRFYAADADLNWDVANELITTYKEVTATVKQESDEQREADLKAVQNASAGSQAGGKKRKIIRKADIWKLKQSNPGRYEQLQPVILQAYREGRVID